jgi:hypothetical protein
MMTAEWSPPHEPGHVKSATIPPHPCPLPKEREKLRWSVRERAAHGEMETMSRAAPAYSPKLRLLVPNFNLR